MMRRLIAALLRKENGHICKVALAPLPGHPVRGGMTVNPVQLLGFDHA